MSATGALWSVLQILLWIGVVILIVAVILWACKYWGIAIDPWVQKALIFIAVVLVIMAIVGVLLGAGPFPRSYPLLR